MYTHICIHMFYVWVRIVIQICNRSTNRKSTKLCHTTVVCQIEIYLAGNAVLLSFSSCFTSKSTK